jgi:hypothetical protein
MPVEMAGRFAAADDEIGIPGGFQARPIPANVGCFTPGHHRHDP